MERYHRTYEYECLRLELPATLAAVEEVNALFKYHYNYERPHQGLSCGNQPPCVAFPCLPVLPKPQPIIDPNHWVDHIVGKYYKRGVTAEGRFQLGGHDYYVSREHAGKVVAVRLSPDSRLLDVIHNNTVLRSVQMKGLHQHRLMFDDYLTLIAREAESEYRRYLATRVRRVATM